MECFEIFKAQNPEDFDVAFEIDGKKLYADKSRLTKISPTFKSMLSDRWISKDETVKIETYGYKNFKEFITFIYSGECSLNNKNIFDMIDIAEFYGVKTFKNACVEYLSKMEYISENVFELFELSDKYSLLKLKESINAFICKNFWNLLKSESYKCLSKPLMKTIVASFSNTLRMEEFFEAVFKWAEFRALKEELDENLNVQETIKQDLAEMLQFFKFDQMSIEFLIKFVVTKASFLFSGEKLGGILSSAHGKVYVRICDENGKIMKGVLICHEMEKVCDVIESQKNIPWINNYYWPTNQSIPTVPSKLIKRHGIEWYLIYDTWGDLAVKKNPCITNNHCLLAEMFADDGFVRNGNCKIEIYRYT
uniref:BTB domain-containing protein n=1 Tax=Panagrolaimus davidi TaxID=227884 RepID=A0A914PQZ7_9BILA